MPAAPATVSSMRQVALRLQLQLFGCDTWPSPGGGKQFEVGGGIWPEAAAKEEKKKLPWRVEGGGNKHSMGGQGKEARHG